MDIYLPIAEMSVNASMLFGLGACIGFLSGLLGITGGFLMTPILIFIGVPPPVAVASQANQLIASSVSGVVSFGRQGRVDYKMGSLILIGGAFGSITGVFFFTFLKEIGQLDIFIAFGYIILLGFIGAMVFYESIRSIFKQNGTEEDEQKSTDLPLRWIQKLPYQAYFSRSRMDLSIIALLTTGFIVSFFLAIMGVGSVIMIPTMIYILRIPPLLVPGTSLFQAMFVATFVTLLHAVTNQTVDVVLALFLLLGGIIGAPLGSQLNSRFRSEYLRLFLALLLLSMSVKLIHDTFTEPSIPYTLRTEEIGS